MNRRQFVISSGTAVISLGLEADAFAARAVQRATSPFVSVGYFSGTPTVLQRVLRSDPAFVPAESILTGDPTFFRTDARFRVDGIQLSERHTISLEVRYAIVESAERIPFFAWSSGGSPVAFNVPVDSQQPVQMVIQRRRAGDANTPETAVVSFGVNTGQDGYRLNTGTYGIVLVEPGQAGPEWRNIRLHEKGLRLVAVNAPEVPFDYFLLSVTHALA